MSPSIPLLSQRFNFVTTRYFHQQGFRCERSLRPDHFDNSDRVGSGWVGIYTSDATIIPHIGRVFLAGALSGFFLASVYNHVCKGVVQRQGDPLSVSVSVVLCGAIANFVGTASAVFGAPVH